MEQFGLFAEGSAPGSSAKAPLAARMRPRDFDEFVGQRHLTAPDAAFRKAVEADRLTSVILWGPPGVGKTTLAEIVARATHAHFARLSAVSAGVADIRKVIEAARARPGRTILFIDEIHRFNKAQQGAILPVVESGEVTLIGATTENPSFEVNSALLSRSRVYILQSLEDADIRQVIERAMTDEERGLAGTAQIEPEAKDALINLANGDARTALNILEFAAASAGEAPIDLPTLESVVQQRSLLYDKEGESHFDIISALHKTIRGSDPDASLYWLARMLESGEDPLYVARRLVRAAVEDVGLAEPQALVVAMSAQQAIHFLGMPEGALALAQCVVFLSTAPKSNRLYEAYSAAQADVRQSRNDPPPLHLRNAPTQMMREAGYGKGYKYAHDYEGGIVRQQNLPDRLAGRTYYHPTDRGFEKKVRERIEHWRALMAEQAEND